LSLQSLHSFPTRRSSDLILAARLVSQIKKVFQFELSLRTFFEERTAARLAAVMVADAAMGSRVQRIADLAINVANFTDNEVETIDRKSTRLNSSHDQISY